jgi:hypothetical protein
MEIDPKVSSIFGQIKMSVDEFVDEVECILEVDIVNFKERIILPIKILTNEKNKTIFEIEFERFNKFTNEEMMNVSCLHIYFGKEKKEKKLIVQVVKERDNVFKRIIF